MSKMHSPKGVALAAAVAVVFSAACTSKEAPKRTEAQSPEEQPFEALEWSIEPIDEAGEKDQSSTRQDVQGEKNPGVMPADQPTEAKVACFGINACKGQSDCATPRNACKGMNSCKGQGFKYVTLKECQAQGGQVGKPSM